MLSTISILLISFYDFFYCYFKQKINIFYYYFYLLLFFIYLRDLRLDNKIWFKEELIRFFVVVVLFIIKKSWYKKDYIIEKRKD